MELKPMTVLKAYLKDAGIDRSELVKLLGVNKSTIDFKLAGRTEFTRAEIAKLCNFLGKGLTLSILFSDVKSDEK